MPLTQTSPNMNIVVPVVLQQVGPAWATNIFNALFTTVDQHDHTSGKGLPIVPAAMNINADLTFAGFNATTLRSARYSSQASPLVLGSDVGCVYNVLGNLYWNNGSGTAVQITNGASVNSASALTGPVVGTRRTVTSVYTIDSITPDYYVEADNTGGAFNITMPTPTSGRTLVIIDVKGNFGLTNMTLVPHSVEKINGASANLKLATPWAKYLIESNGTDWFVSVEPSWQTQNETTISAANVSIGATDPYSLYYVNTTSNQVTITLPATSSTQVGKTYYLNDFKSQTGTNAILLAPTGADNINGVNANMVLAFPGATWVVTTDGAGNWYVSLIPSQLSSGMVRTKTSNYTIDSTGRDFFLNCDTTGGAFTVTLPTPTVGRSLTLTDSKGNFGTNALTLNRHSTELINGVAASKFLNAPWAQYTITSDGTNWFVVGS